LFPVSNGDFLQKSNLRISYKKKIIEDKLSRDGSFFRRYADFLAAEAKTNVRELIGVINSVIAYSTIYKSDLSLELLKDTINKICSKSKKVINIPYIQEVVCDYFGIKREQLLSKTRKREIASKTIGDVFR
jgi:chromosomal replication initiator protein